MAGFVKKKAYLVLADGTIFSGYSMGKAGTTIGEVVFNTCTASYQELLGDPTYYGQIVAQTYPLVGNRGVGMESSDIMASGYIAREWCDTPVDTHGGVTLDKYLRQRDIVGLYGIDTRRLTRTLRDKGYFNGAITDTLDNLDQLLEKIHAYTIAGAVSAVTVPAVENISCESAQYHVTVIDYGFPRAMLGSLTARGCEVTIVPAFTSPEDILAQKPDGIVFSDGPGDPDDEPALIETIRMLMKQGIPSLGIGLGHQMMALAIGAKIMKMPKGHRGSNQPVRCRETGRLMVTMQNHGYTVEAESIPSDLAEITLENVNDHSVEGLSFSGCRASSVQFTPADGQDTAWVYDAFLARMRGENSNE